ncbi:Hsp70 family protein [Prosthecomicrobium sp. N25]|uniref:Hsp70 family protein n=1 Tax=Prosthecomicrobium sp. N25 TaxID=3129254 RepID=UPI003076B3DF
MADMQGALGVDFGTTNTVLAAAGPDGPTVLPFDTGEGPLTAFRSVLCFWQAMIEGRAERRVETGPWALDRYVADPHDCRFLQSFKSFAASRSFTDTMVYGRRLTFEALLATFLESLAGHYGGRIPTGARVVVGRPVTFVGGAPDEALALARYEAGFQAAGFDEIHFVYEPVAAAYFFAERLAADATVLVADFGGGTSDFSVLRFERRGGRLHAAPLGAAGVGIAGDSFDSRIVEHLVGPRIGRGSAYRSFGKVLPLPVHYFADFAQWHTLSLLKSPATLRELRELARTATDPEALERFLTLIEEDLGYALYRAVARTKLALSDADRATFDFAAEGIAIRAEVRRADFEAWIAGDLARIAAAVDAALDRAGTPAAAIDRVFLTGGTSYVPAVRRLFAERFGTERMESGNEFDSIAAGLALIAREPDLEAWTAPRPA